MTAAAVALADRGLLAALAIAYDKAGVRDRPAKLAHAAAHVGRPLTSTAELTADEARTLRRHVRRCGPDCAAAAPPAVLELVAPQHAAACACIDGGRPGVASACDPRGSGRYCAPRRCYCGHCPWWTPQPPVNYDAAIARLADQPRGER